MDDADMFDMPIMARNAKGERIKETYSWLVKPEHRRQAQRNHGQSLERLRERGGLDWQEMRWVLLGINWKGDRRTQEEAKAECIANLEFTP